jgi:hypothetical protein
MQEMASNASASFMCLESASVLVDPLREELNSEDITNAPNEKLLPKRAVSFDNVEIREYARCLGNNPATTNGPSLSLDWCYAKMGTINLDDYELTRPPRRRMDEMHTSGVQRLTILKEHTKCSKNDISESVEAIQIARHKRLMCVAMQEFEHWHVGLESLKRKVKRWRKNTSTKREQELLWENADRIMAEKRRLKNEQVSDEFGNTSTSSDSSCSESKEY